MVRLKPVTGENLDEVLALKVHESQAGFVSTPAESLAQAYVYPETAFPFAVYDDQTVVGFIMMGYYEAKQYYTLWKLLIDERYQHQGYGRQALEQGIEFLKENLPFLSCLQFRSLSYMPPDMPQPEAPACRQPEQF